jgi:hypothetical protein
MPKLLIKEIAQQQGVSISELQRKADIMMATCRRYWYNTRSGKTKGEPMDRWHVPTMMAIGRVLGVRFTDLFSDD